MRKRDRTSEERQFDSMLASGLMRLGENPNVVSAKARSKVAQPHQTFPYVLAWDRLGRKGQRFRVINPRPRAKLVIAEFEDGFTATVDRRAIRRSD